MDRRRRTMPAGACLAAKADSDYRMGETPLEASTVTLTAGGFFLCLLQSPREDQVEQIR
jgi:hypothetical protein